MEVAASTPGYAWSQLRPNSPPSEPLTIVAASLDPTSGNVPFIRGQGEGLSWDKGRPLSYLDEGTWVWSTRQSGDPLVFKLLLNDEIWAEGEDLVVQPGTTIDVAPVFA